MSVSIYVAIEGQGVVIDGSYEGKYLADDPKMLDEIAKAQGVQTMMSFLGDEPTTEDWDEVLATKKGNRWFEAQEGVRTFKNILERLQQAQSIEEDDEDDGLRWTIEGVIKILEDAEAEGKRFHLVGSW